MARWTFRYTDPDGATFAPGAWDSQVGTVVPHTLRETDDGPVLGDLGMVKLVAAVVVEDGAAVLLTVESEGGGPEPLAALVPMSFTVREEKIPERWWPW